MQPCQNEGKIATLEANHKNIMKILEEIRDDFKGFQISCNNTYATKKEVENNNCRLDRLERILDKILFIAVGWAITVVWLWILFFKKLWW